MKPRDRLGWVGPAGLVECTTAPRWARTQRLTAGGAVILGGTLLLASGLGILFQSSTPGDGGVYAGTVHLRELTVLEGTLDSTRTELATAQEELRRARRLIGYSARYNIPADLAASIYDHAAEAGIDPELGFRLVRVESRFNPRAVSRAGAYGLAQVQLATARYYVRDITADDLFDRDVNLGIGFRFLSDLLKQFDGDLRLALIAYNRGPARLRGLLAGGIPPWNGYASSVLDGYDPSSP